MPSPELQIGAAVDDRMAPVLAAIRAEFHIPDAFPADVEAEAAAVRRDGGRCPPGAEDSIEDALDLPLVTIDPEGARDLDQAYLGEPRQGGGFRVHYAIADVAWFVAPGGALDREAAVRGVTLYQPDRRTALYPEVLGQGMASLLADQERPALLWSIDLDADALPTGDPRFRRVRVRSRRQLTYAEAQRELDDERASDSLRVLREVGRLREQREADRGGVSLRLPAQEVGLGSGRPTVTFEASIPVEGWNAQISLLAGIVAAEIMLGERIGILRTLPAPQPDALDGLRRSAAALGVDWPSTVSYADFVRGLDPDRTIGAVLLHLAARTLRGAGYTAFDGEVPAEPVHSAVASPYAHVTAPLRRLADRLANEVLLALVGATAVPEWARAALPGLPEIMQEATRREKGVERAVVDGAEAVLLAPRVGETFAATVIASDPRRSGATVQLTDPAVVGPLTSAAAVGSRLEVRLVEADPVARRIRFEPVGDRVSAGPG